MQILICFLFSFFSFLLKKNHRFIPEDNPSEKVVLVEEELDGIDIVDIGNIEDSPRVGSMRNSRIS